MKGIKKYLERHNEDEIMSKYDVFKHAQTFRSNIPTKARIPSAPYL